MKRLDRYENEFLPQVKLDVTDVSFHFYDFFSCDTVFIFTDIFVCDFPFLTVYKGSFILAESESDVTSIGFIGNPVYRLH